MLWNMNFNEGRSECRNLQTGTSTMKVWCTCLRNDVPRKLDGGRSAKQKIAESFMKDSYPLKAEKRWMCVYSTNVIHQETSERKILIADEMPALRYDTHSVPTTSTRLTKIVWLWNGKSKRTEDDLFAKLKFHEVFMRIGLRNKKFHAGVVDLMLWSSKFNDGLAYLHAATLEFQQTSRGPYAVKLRLQWRSGGPSHFESWNVSWCQFENEDQGMKTLTAPFFRGEDHLFSPLTTVFWDCP